MHQLVLGNQKISKRDEFHVVCTYGSLCLHGAVGKRPDYKSRQPEFDSLLQHKSFDFIPNGSKCKNIGKAQFTEKGASSGSK